MERCVVGWAGVRSEETDNPEESRGWTAVGVVGTSLKGFFSLARGVSWSGDQSLNMIWKYLNKSNSSSSIVMNGSSGATFYIFDPSQTTSCYQSQHHTSSSNIHRKPV